jgi:hypothetical protein
LTDVAARNLTTGQWFVGINTGSAFSFSVWATWSPAVTWADVMVGDFNGAINPTTNLKMDGIVGRYQQAGIWYVGTSLGTSFNTTAWAFWSPSVTWVDSKVGDFNGDGKADIVSRYLEGGAWYVGTSNGTGFNTQLWAQWSNAVTWVDTQVGDFNGDGKSDIVSRYKEAGVWYVGVSTGNSFNTQFWAQWSNAVTWADVRVGDFNGAINPVTGLRIDDIIGRYAEAGVWYVGQSTGTSFNTTAWAFWNPGVTWVDPIVGDFNGDGKDDIAERFLQAGQWFTGISSGTGFNTTLWDTWSPAVTWTGVQLMKNV